MKRAFAVVFLIAVSGSVYAGKAKPGHVKVLVGKASLLRLPDASEPPQLLSGLDAEVLEEYEDFQLATVTPDRVMTLMKRAEAAGIRLQRREKYDRVIINGHTIDASLGTRLSLGPKEFDPPYPVGEIGAWVIQFHGPIKTEWSQRVRAEGGVIGQYIPYNAVIVAADPAAASRIDKLPFVQLVEQLHTFMKPRPPIGPDEERLELWIQLAETKTTPDALALLEKLSVGNFSTALWSDVERRVDGDFSSRDLERILREPLVLAVTRTPTIAMSDERVAMSVTNVPPRTQPKTYQKWLEDLCDVCDDLEGYRIGIADLGIDGGFFAAPPAAGQNDPPSSGSHRSELAATRLIRGGEFQDKSGTYNAGCGCPDSTGSLHDTQGHGTLVAGVAAGNPTPSGAADENGAGFFWGTGVAPAASLVITRIDTNKITTRDANTLNPAARVRTVASDARLHPTHRAYIQNHSYNQYTSTFPPKDCPEYFDGYYTWLSRDFDAAVRDADVDIADTQQITLTVSSGNVAQQGSSAFGPCSADRRHTLPPATAKNVIAVGMAENDRPDSAAWNCSGSSANGYDNVASNGKTGTAVPGWFKPDLMAPASSVASSKSHDIQPNSGQACQNGPDFEAPDPPVPAEFIGQSGTSFAAPVAAGAALLASRYFANRLHALGQPADASTASPALLKAMLIAGATSMAGGRDRSRIRGTWTPRVNYAAGERVIPRNPLLQGSLYEAQTSRESGSFEPPWPSPNSGGDVTETTASGGTGVRWKEIGAETTVTSLPNDRQGFGRINLAEVLSRYPARDFINQTAPLSSGGSWIRPYRVHDTSLPVRVALVWTDPPAAITDPATHITTPPLVNDLDLSIQLGNPCTGMYVGNRMLTTNVSEHRPCAPGDVFDELNNVEVARFFVPDANVPFTVKVSRVDARPEVQDFALVVYNAYQDGHALPLGAPSNLVAAATSASQVALNWTAAVGATLYSIQRSNRLTDPFATVGTTTVNSFADVSVQPGTTYLYRVRAQNGTAVESTSNVDPATTVLFTDEPIVAGSTLIRADHLTQLRQVISAMRTTAGLPAATWTGPTPVAASSVILAAHVSELRAALDATRTAFGLSNAAYDDPAIAAGTPVRAVHFQQLRDRVLK